MGGRRRARRRVGGGLNGRLVELDPRSARIRRRVTLPADEFAALAVGDAVWVTSWQDGKLWRVTADEDAVPVSATVGSGITDVAVTAGAVWVANPINGTVTPVDPATMRVGRPVSIGGSPRSLAIDGDTLWVAVSGAGEAAATSEVAGVAPLPSSICEPVVAGAGGKADVLVVSDLPLQGDFRRARRRWRRRSPSSCASTASGPAELRLAYQSCDDALAGTGLYDEAKCAANGRAYGRDADVLAVIGTYNSGCALTLIPALNRARGGPVGMVSPVNSYVGLTRGGPEVNVPTDLSDLYPTGVRNYVRAYPADDLQSPRSRSWRVTAGSSGCTCSTTARRVTARRSPTGSRPRPASSGSTSSDASGGGPRRAPTRGSRSGWRTRARRRSSSRASSRTTAARWCARCGRASAKAVDLMGPDGFAPPALLREAAGRPRAASSCASTQVTERFPPAGRAFVERFSARSRASSRRAVRRLRRAGDRGAADALERSDGTRASVIDELFRVRLDDSLVGDVAFDDRGDIVRGAVTCCA